MKNIKKYLLFFKNYFFVKRWEPYCAPMRVVNEEETIIIFRSLLTLQRYIFFFKKANISMIFFKKKGITLVVKECYPQVMTKKATQSLPSSTVMCYRPRGRDIII